LLVALTLFPGCGRDALTALSEGRSTLRIVPGQAELFVGQTFRFDVERVGPDGAESVLDEPGLELAVAPNEVARLVGRRIQAQSAGLARLSARLGRSESMANVEVVDATLESLAVDPERATLAVGAQLQLSVSGRLSDGQIFDLTDPATGTEYASADRDVARVDPGGLVRARGPGETTITINQSGASADVRIAVVDVPTELAELRIDPNPVRVAVRATERVRAVGVTADGDSIILPPESLSVWAIDDPAVATVDLDGVVTAQSRGTSVLRAGFANPTGPGLATQAQVVVGDREPQLVGLRIEPRESLLRVGEDVQLEVIATFDDGLIRDVSNDGRTEYTVLGDSGVVRDVGGGRFDSQSAGTVQIRASFEGQDATATIVVEGDGRVVELRLTPRPIALEVDTAVDIQIVARFQTGEERDVTEEATFIPPATGALEYSPETRSLVGVREGEGTLRFEYRGVSVTSPYVVIETARVLELRFEPDPIAVREGETESFALLGELPGGGTFDVTFLPGIVYTVADPDFADVDPGSVRGVRRGATRLSATIDGRSARVVVEVLPGERQLVAVELSIPPVVEIGRPTRLRVIARYDDGTGEDVSSSEEAAVLSEVPSTLVINGGSGDPLVAVGLEVGDTRVTARYRGFEDSRIVNVSPSTEPLEGLVFRPGSLGLDVLGEALVRVLAQSGGSTENVSGSEDLILLPSREVDVSPLEADVQILGIRNGEGRVQAFYRGLAAILVVDVSGPSLTGLRIEAPMELDVGGAATVRTFAVRADGTEAEVDAELSVADPTIAALLPRSVLEGIREGVTVITAELAGFSASAEVAVVQARIPRLRQLEPEQLDLDAADRALAIVGTGFQIGDTVRIGGSAVVPSFISGTRVELEVPASLLRRPDRLPVRVESPSGPSNPLFLQVGLPPAIERVVPDVAVPGQTVRVRAIGRNLIDLRAVPPAGWTVDGLVERDDGRVLAFDVTAPVNAPPSGSIVFENDLDRATVGLDTRPIGPALDVVLDRRLTGTQVVRSLTVGSEGSITSNSPDEPLVFLVAGDVTIEGDLDASGLDGRGGQQPRGGEGGPGGGGGGGGGEGDAASGALGGSGTPPGDGAEAGQGSGQSTRGGDGGGRGAGSASDGTGLDCGAGGGGGAAEGDGGDGGDGLNNADGGSGGDAPGRSDYLAGTGGGGGSACIDEPAGSGGGGGGLLEIQLLGSGTIDVSGRILANGGQGGAGRVGGSGGGGGAGTIRLRTQPGGTIILGRATVVSAAGGDGGGSGGLSIGGGGGGGGGRIVLDAGATGTIRGRNDATLDVTGGAGSGFGGRAGEAGGNGRIETTP